jgi:hypothetical protein
MAIPIEIDQDAERVVTVKNLRGKKRSTKEIEITLTGKNIAVNPDKGVLVQGSQSYEGFVRSIADLFVQGARYTKETQPDWATPYCEKIEKVAGSGEEGFSTWHLAIHQPYLD